MVVIHRMLDSWVKGERKIERGGERERERESKGDREGERERGGGGSERERLTICLTAKGRTSLTLMLTSSI